eukprot:scaffold57959_cov69-Phaeocystis_antarctica.AAC.2
MARPPRLVRCMTALASSADRSATHMSTRATYSRLFLSSLYSCTWYSCGGSSAVDIPTIACRRR